MTDEIPRDTHRDLPDDAFRHGFGHPTFRELGEAFDEHDKELKYEARFKAIERRQNNSLAFLITLGVIAFILLICVLVIFFTGTVK